MNIRLLIIALLFVSLLFETSIVAFPFIFILSIILYILYPDPKTLISVFLASLILDALKVAIIGVTPLLIFATFFLLEIVKGAFEINDYKIIILILLIFSFIYSKISSYTDDLSVYMLTFGAAWVAISYFYKKSLW